MKKCCFLLIFLPLFAFSQTPPDELRGIALRDWLKANWYDGQINTLSYDNARGHIYGLIDNVNNTITGVYAGYERSVPSGSPTTNVSPINCEHTVPQSLFNEDDPMKSDIHHLFPTYGNWNSARSNYRLEDIPDEETLSWMYKDIRDSIAPPLNVRDNYAESNVVYGDWWNPNNRFEPREVQKGNSARAIFYFYTMYPTGAGNISDVATLYTLCTWHINDPVDAREMARNDAIEVTQGNRNPFVDLPLDVAKKAWGCNLILTGINTVETETIRLFPNPSSQYFQVEITEAKAAPVTYDLYDTTGRKVLTVQEAAAQFQLDTGELPAGVYFLTARQGERVWQQRLVKM